MHHVREVALGALITACVSIWAFGGCSEFGSVIPDAPDDDSGAPGETTGSDANEDAVDDDEVSAKDYEVTTYAGTGERGAADGDRLAATYNRPYGIALGVGLDGNPDGSLYVADTSNQKIRKIAPDGKVSTYAGTGVTFPLVDDDSCTNVTFYFPYDIAMDTRGNLYVADESNNAIRVISPAPCKVFTLAGNGTFDDVDGAGLAAAFGGPTGLALNAAGTLLFVADYGNNKIRQVALDIDKNYSAVTTLAGKGRSNAGYTNGIITEATFATPHGIAIDAKTGSLYVTERHDVRKITKDSQVSTLVGSQSGVAGTLIDKTGADARFNVPGGVALDTDGNLYVADRNNHAIRRVTQEGKVTTIAGKRTDLSGAGEKGYADGQGDEATFNEPSGVAVDAKTGVIYVADEGNHKIRKITRKPKN